MARLLIINYRFLPAQTVSSKRLGHFYVEAKRAFDEVVVLASHVSQRYPADPLFDIDIGEIEYIRHLDFRSGVQKQPGQKTRWLDKLKQTKGGRMILSLRKRWPLFYLLGDGGADYIAKAVQRSGQLIKKRGITHIFTSYGPYADLIIGYRLKKRFPELTWIADFRDIFENQPDQDYPGRYAFWYMKNKVRLADRVTTVSQGLADRLSSLHTQVSVLYNGLGPFSIHPDGKPPQESFRISYTGSLYGRWEALTVFFKVLSHIQGPIASDSDAGRLAFNYAGRDRERVNQMALQHPLHALSCSFESHLSMREAMRYQKESHINLLLSWSHPKQKGILNAKLFEYLGAGRPIWAIVKGPVDKELIYWVEEVGGGRCYFLDKHSPEEIANGVKQMIEEIKSGIWRPPQKLPSKMYWSLQGAQFWAAVLEDKKAL